MTLLDQKLETMPVGAVAALLGVDAAGRPVLDRSLASYRSPQMYGTVTAGVDALALINLALADIEAAGGGTLLLPYIGGAGYAVSNAIVVDFNNCTIVLCDDLALTNTTATSGSPLSAIRFVGTSSVFLENPALIAPRRVRIDCNGRNASGYTHVPGSDASVADHHGVLFRFCKNVRTQNVYAYNGLIGCITTSYCLGGEIADCDASDSVYDNGIYLFGNGEQIVTFSETNPATWSNIRVVRPRAWNCANHGLGIYGAVGTHWENPKIWNCGNNTGVAGAGPAGGLGVENDGTNFTRNYRFTATDVEVTGSYGFGIRTNCKGTVIKGGFVRGTKIPTAYTDSSPAIWGSAVFIQTSATDAVVEVDINGSERVGIRVQGGTPYFAGVRFKGLIELCVERAVYALQFGTVEIDPSSIVQNNGASGNTTPGDFYTVDLSNSAGNVDAGVARISGRFVGNYGGLVQGARIGTIDLFDISGSENLLAYSSAFHALYFPSVIGLLQARDIVLHSSGNKQARILKADLVSVAYVDKASILGSQSNDGVPKAEITATVQRSSELVGTKTWDAPSVAALTSGVPGTTTTTVTITGAALGDAAAATLNVALSGLAMTAEVTSANTATVTLWNFTGSAIDLASARLVVRTQRSLGQ